ncbi:MAG: pyridoxamine 5'-phosphate oxidase [Ginsengibacter sp.]
MEGVNSIADMRRIYQLQAMLEKDMNENPIKQFENWWQHAIDSKIDEPNAMSLATATASGKPSVRTVLLKGIKENGFMFFTNYQSRKGKEIEENPYVSLLFFWKELERQVRIEGSIQKLSTEDSDEYFSERPHESQIGAWSSPQSSIIESRNLLQNKMEEYEKRFGANEIPRPDYWGGYIIQPYSMEFWQGRPGRLHDRLQYTLDENNRWVMKRLAP